MPTPPSVPPKSLNDPAPLAATCVAPGEDVDPACNELGAMLLAVGPAKLVAPPLTDSVTPVDAASLVAAAGVGGFCENAATEAEAAASSDAPTVVVVLVVVASLVTTLARMSMRYVQKYSM